jgi:hypothetical protein
LNCGADKASIRISRTDKINHGDGTLINYQKEKGLNFTKKVF